MKYLYVSYSQLENRFISDLDSDPDLDPDTRFIYGSKYANNSGSRTLIIKSVLSWRGYLNVDC
jgi:hypothetical protein